MVYQPQAYKVEFKDNLVVSNIKINPKAQDFVTPYYPHELEPNLGIGRSIINADGDNTGTAQTSVSQGCSAAGACNFKVAKGTRIWTNNGIQKIEKALGTSPVVQAIEAEACKKVLVQSSSTVYQVTTYNGHTLKCDHEHKFMVYSNGALKEVSAKEPCSWK